MYTPFQSVPFELHSDIENEIEFRFSKAKKSEIEKAKMNNNKFHNESTQCNLTIPR